MAEYELLMISVISTIGGLFGLWIINQNWFKRQEVKYKYRLKTAKLNKKFPKEIQGTPAPGGELTQLIKTYAPQLLKGSEDEEEGNVVGDVLGGILERLPDGTLEKLADRYLFKKEEDQDEGTGGYIGG